MDWPRWALKTINVRYTREREITISPARMLENAKNGPTN